MANPGTPLEGVVIADHTILGPGPYATELLARLGARVIKLEAPGGDPARRIPGLWNAFNGDKESALCDLRSDEGRALALAVAARADAFVNSWRPGVAERLGLGAPALLALNPAIVHCTLTGFGSTGPLRARPGHELNYLAASGALTGIMGESLDYPGLPIGDTAAGMFAALRIVSAILSARTTGIGGEIEVSVAGVLSEFASIGASADDSIVSAKVVNPAYGVFLTADDRRVVLGVLDEQPFWDALCDALGLENLRPLTPAEYIPRAEELRPLVAAAVGRHTLADLERLFEPHANIPWNTVEAADAVDIPFGVPQAERRPPDLDADGDRIRAEFLA